MEDLKCWLESQKEQIVKDIEGLVSIESVAEKVKEHSQAPFG